MKRPIRIIVLILLLVLSMVMGCTSNAPTSGSTTPPAAETTKAAAEAPTDDAADTAAEAPEPNSYDEAVTLSVCAMLTEGTDYLSDDMMKHFNEMFNVTIDPVALSWADWGERNRVWITSGDMPDVMFWDFNYPDYANYVKQGLVKQLPDDLYERYPNLANALGKTGLADYLIEKDGSLSCIPRVVFLDMPSERMTYHLTCFYRKDLATQLGYDFGPLVQYDDFFEYVQDAMELEEGIAGLMSSYTYIINTFCRMYQPYFDTFWKVDGKYDWMPSTNETLQGLQVIDKYYNEGLIYKDFFTMKSVNDYRPLFFAGKCVAYINDGPFGVYRTTFNDWTAAYPDIAPEDGVGFCNLVVEPDVWTGIEAVNYWTVALLSPSLTDTEMYRYFDMIDYIATTETQYFIHLGFEGQDWERDASNNITVTRPTNTAGNFVALSEIYPSTSIFGSMVVLSDDFSAKDPTTNPTAWQICKDLYDARGRGNLWGYDFDLWTFSAPYFDKTNINVHDEFTALLLKDGSIDTEWNAWVEANMPLVQPALDELNTMIK